MKSMHLPRVALAAVLTTVLGLGPSAPPASAQVPPLVPLTVVSTPLPLSGFADILVDHQRDRVLVSGGRNDNQIVILDYDGNIVETVSEMPAAAGMVMIGERLFVARDGGAAVDVLNADSLERIGIRRLRETTGGRLVYANGRLWTSGGECGSWEDLQSIDLRTKRVRIEHSSSLYCSTFFSTPANPHLIMTGTVGLSPAKVTAWDTSTRPIRGRESDHGDEMGTGDVAFAPDGMTFLSALGGATEFRLRNLEQTGIRYPISEGGSTSVAQTEAEGGYVAVGTAGDEANLHVFRKRETTPASSYLLSGGPVAPRSTRFAPDGGRIFAVTHDPYGSQDEDDPPVFHSVLSGPTADRTSIELDIPTRRIRFGQAIRAAVQLGHTAAAAPVSILEIPFGGRPRVAASGQTNESGAATFRLRPQQNSSYVALWAGDEERLPAVSRSVAVRVRPRVTLQLRRHVGRSGRTFLYRVNRPIEMIGRSEAIPRDRRLTFQIQVFAEGRWWSAGSIDDRIGRTSEVAREVIYATRPVSFRIRASVAASWDRIGSSSRWRYLTATR